MDPLECTSPWFAFARDQAKARPFEYLWSLAEQLKKFSAYRGVAGSLPMWLELFLAASFDTA
jgi:hypothetical protein